MVYPQPVPDIHPRDIDFKKMDKDKFFTFYKANRILYTRGHERVRSDLYLEEMTRLLDISLKNDIISGVLLYERYAEVSGNPISKKHLAAVKELKRKSNYDIGTFFPINKIDLQEQSEQSLGVFGKSLNKMAYADDDNYTILQHTDGSKFLDRYMGDSKIRDQILLEDRKTWVFRRLSHGFDYQELGELTKL